MPSAADDAPEDEKHRYAVIGNPKSFWLHTTKSGFDLTQPEKPSSPQVQPRLLLQTTTTSVTISPTRSALVIIDMQNFFLSEAFGRSRGAGHDASEKLMKYAIPAARKAGIQVLWLNWGLSSEDVEDMPPAIKRAFGFEAVIDDSDGTRAEEADAFGEKPNGIGVDKHGDLKNQSGHRLLERGKNERIYKGLGSECGEVTLPNGETVDAGRLLVRDTWNAALYPPLNEYWQEGKQLPKTPDVWVHKNRLSGMWGASTPCQKVLEEKGIKTLLFTGVNTDQCVSGTLTDSFSKGYDCILLNDGCGTTSPDYAQLCIEFNSAKTWGFVTSCEDLLKGADEMVGQP